MKKILSFLTISALALAGCSSGSSGSKEASKEVEKANEIEVWLTPQWKGTYEASEEGADYDSFLKTAAELYKEENPDVNIKIQVIPGDERDSKLSVATQTNTLPDVFFESSFAMTNYAHQGLIAPIDDIVDPESKKDISENVWNNVKIGENSYFYPFAQNPGMLVYNVKMFEDAGLGEFIGEKSEIANWSVEDFEKILTTLKEKNDQVAPLGFFAKNNQADTWTMMYLRMFGSPFFDDKGLLAVNDAEGVKALEQIKSWNDKGLITKGAESLASTDVNAMFQNQQVAISFANAVLYQGMLDNQANGTLDEFDIRLASIPSVDGPKSFTYVVGSAVFNTNGEARQALAKDFVKFYSENADLVNASTNFLPVRESVVESAKADNPLLAAYLNNDQYVINFSNNTPGYAEVRNALFPEIQAVLTGEKDAQAALDSFVDNGNKAIEKGQKFSKVLGNN
ncbi:multiple sugar transport system substrate-binding protein [Streptococcus rupicaprae]|uniref:Multiple sugar transport system substrate-binding protein n=1 Tax=Streptococcus rupicaprae TaxID=759619 RepID=A0ABV2FEC5_9STRE